MSDDLETLDRRLAEARLREQQLRTKLASAENAYTAALEERRCLLVDGEMGDAQTLNSLDRTVVETERAIAALIDAIRLAGERTAEAQRQVVDAADRAKREAEAEKVHALITGIDKALKPLNKAAAAGEQALKAAGALCPEANAAAGLVRSMQHDLQIITQQAVSDLKSYDAAIERGGKLRRTVSNESAPKTRTPKPATQRVFFIEHAKWAADGRVLTARQFSTHDLPPDLAQKAIGCALALDTGHETAAKLRPIFGDGSALPTDPAICIDLDRLDPSVDLRRVGPQVILDEQAKETAA